MVVVVGIGLASHGGCALDDQNQCGDRPFAELGVVPANSDPWRDGADGEDAVLEIGSQGGFHLWAHARAQNLCPGGVILHGQIELVDTGELVFPASMMPGRIEAASGQDPGWLFSDYPFRFQICPTLPSIDVIDQRIRLVVTIEDELANTASTEREITVRCPADHIEVANVCHRICDSDLDE